MIKANFFKIFYQTLTKFEDSDKKNVPKFLGNFLQYTITACFYTKFVALRRL